MKKVYTLLNTKLKCKDDIIEIPFAIVFLEDGIYYFETIVKDIDFYKKYNGSYLTLLGVSEKREQVEAYGLVYRTYTYESGSSSLVCEGVLKLTADDSMFKADPKPTAKSKEPIYGIEVEGLQMHFADHTEFKRSRRGEELDDFLNFEFDHTHTALVVNHESILTNFFNAVFTANKDDNTILIDFSNEVGYNRLYYEDYLKFRKELINFLSFINGDFVYLKKEFTGNFVSKSGLNGGMGAQVSYIYSNLKTDKRPHSDYIPINISHGFSIQIMNVLFTKCFDQFYKLGKVIDLSALVNSLNNAYETLGAKEKYYILITALEKISSDFSKVADKKSTLIDETFFDETLKAELLSVLEKHKKSVKVENSIAYDIYLSRIGQLNKLSDRDTKYRLYNFFAYANIAISPYITQLVESERNTAVHEGKTGNNYSEEIRNYWKLDHLLRDILLNLIGYDRMRNPKVKYVEPFPYSTPWQPI